MNTPGPLGWIRPADRTPEERRAHEEAMAHYPRFGLQPPRLEKGQRVELFKAWRDAKVVADVGFVFPRFRQLTGSCVGVGGGCALFTLIALQRLFATQPQRAFIPWWPHPYGKSRFLLGDKSPGEGSLGSTFYQALMEYGVFSSKEEGLPAFDTSDGLALTNKQEMEWSDGDDPPGSKYDSVAKQHVLKAGAEVKDVAALKAAIVNGYPCSFACNNYIGSAKVEGSGADACVIGYWDGSGGHQQSVHAVWEHPSFGPLYWVQNTWDGGTYPSDPAGGPICGCWVREDKVKAAFGLDAEVYALSSLPWFPADPDVLDWSQL